MLSFSAERTWTDDSRVEICAILVDRVCSYDDCYGWLRSVDTYIYI